MMLRREGSTCVGAVLIASALLLISACASKTPTQFYSLRVQPNQALEISLPASLRLGVGPISLPSELDRPGIVSEKNGSAIKIAAYQVWAGELHEMTATVLAGLMAEHTGLQQVYAAPWDTRFRPEYQLRVDVQRFSGELGGDVGLDAVWTLSGDAGKTLIHTERSTLRQRAENSSYLAYVHAMNALLSQLSALVANTLEDAVSGDPRSKLPRP